MRQGEVRPNAEEARKLEVGTDTVVAPSLSFPWNYIVYGDSRMCLTFAQGSAEAQAQIPKFSVLPARELSNASSSVLDLGFRMDLLGVRVN